MFLRTGASTRETRSVTATYTGPSWSTPAYAKTSHRVKLLVKEHGIEVCRRISEVYILRNRKPSLGGGTGMAEVLPRSWYQIMSSGLTPNSA